MKLLSLVFLLGFSCNVMADWIEYATEPNGDIYFFDDARIARTNRLHQVFRSSFTKNVLH